jgi:hypothetical protein
MSALLDVAIIGAGPYGVSIAAHLREKGIDHRIFGDPLRMWQQHMPPGMMLKSDGKSSDICDPRRSLTLEEFCRGAGIEYHPTQLPVKIETFIAYGLEFQRRFASRVELRHLVQLDRRDAHFILHFDDGELLTAKHVILAVGMMAFKFVPEGFAHLPSSLVSHSSDFGSLAPLNGREVAIIGAGSSALDLAALLYERGIGVTVIARSPEVAFHGPPLRHRRIDQMIRAPDSNIGAGWLMRICDDAPRLIHALPERVRSAIVRNTLGPSGGYFIKDRVVGKVSVQTGRTIVSSAETGGRVLLRTRSRDNSTQEHEYDHLLLATGYKLDVKRLTFLSPALLSEIKVAAAAPTLSANFESSVPGLFFVGYSSIGSFGPVMRFVTGTRHPSPRLAAHLGKHLIRGFSAVPSRVAG